jgi:hypothetical protein
MDKQMRQMDKQALHVNYDTPDVVYSLYYLTNVSLYNCSDRLCGLVVRGPGSIPGATRSSDKYYVWNGVHLASWVQLRSYLEEKGSGSSLEIREYGHRGSASLTTRHPSIQKSWN